MEKLLTISVAAYNVDNYLDQLMQSVIEADVMDALEVLIVNDGSKDGTAAKALSYQQQYPASVRLIDKENGGHGSTINCGIREAKGKYFRALDGDDWVCPEHLAALVRRMDQIDADLILSEYCKCYEDGRQIVSDDFPSLTDGTLYSFDEIIAQVKWMCYHAVIYRTEVLQAHNIHLDEHCFYVDTEFMLFPIPFVETVYYAKDYIYCYRLGLTEQSVSAESRRKNIANGYTVYDSIMKCYLQYKEELSPGRRNYFINAVSVHCLWYIQSLLLFPASKEKKQEIIQFDQGVRTAAPECYDEMAKNGSRSKSVRALRKTHYLAYRLLCFYKNKK